MVAYWAIIIVTVLIFTYITYKISSLWAFDFSPRILILCGFFACILGLLGPQIIAYASSVILWLIALLSLLALSSYALSKSTDLILAPETVDTEAMPSSREFVTEDIVADTKYSPPVTALLGGGFTVGGVAEIPAAKVADCAREEEREEEKKEEKASTVNSAENQAEEEENTENLMAPAADNQDIDYYLELGFAAKEAGDFSVAVTAFKKAIDLEPDNSSTLYIIAEICAIFTQQGFYEKSIQQMEAGRNLAITLQNYAMFNEFVAGIAYLRILKNILLTKGIYNTPYPALPENVKAEIDDEFRLWKHQ